MWPITKRKFLQLSATSVVATAASLSPAVQPLFAAGQSPALGAVAVRDGPATVLSKLGSPQVQTSTHGLGTPEWHYPGLIVRFRYVSPGELGVMQILLATASAGSTPAGIRVGSSVAELERAYGAALVDYGPGGFSLPLSASTRLNFSQQGGTIISIALTDVTCPKCTPRTGPQGGGKGR